MSSLNFGELWQHHVTNPPQKGTQRLAGLEVGEISPNSPDEYHWISVWVSRFYGQRSPSAVVSHDVTSHGKIVLESFSHFLGVVFAQQKAGFAVQICKRLLWYHRVRGKEIVERLGFWAWGFCGTLPLVRSPPKLSSHQIRFLIIFHIHLFHFTFLRIRTFRLTSFIHPFTSSFLLSWFTPFHLFHSLSILRYHELFT